MSPPPLQRDNEWSQNDQRVTHSPGIMVGEKASLPSFLGMLIFIFMLLSCCCLAVVVVVVNAAAVVIWQRF